MRRTLLIVAVLAVPAAAPAATLDASNYRWERALEAERGLAAFEPDGPMYEHAAVGLRRREGPSMRASGRFRGVHAASGATSSCRPQRC